MTRAADSADIHKKSALPERYGPTFIAGSSTAVHVSATIGLDTAPRVADRYAINLYGSGVLSFHLKLRLVVDLLRTAGLS